MAGRKVVPLRRRAPAGKTMRVGGPIDEVRVTLALYSEDLEPDEVTCALGLQPTSAHRRGERRGPRSPPYRQGAWFLTEQSREREGAEPVIERLLERLPNDAGLWSLLGSKHDVQIRLGLHMSGWNEGFEISRELIARISVLGATLRHLRRRQRAVDAQCCYT